MQHNTSLIALNLRHNQIGPDGAIAIAKALQYNTTLTELDLRYNQMGPGGTIVIAEALQTNKTLTELYLSSNQIGNAAAITIAKALQHNTSLIRLYLSNNQIDDKGVIAIANELKKNTALTCFDLSQNQISNDGAIAIIDLLTINKTLVFLYIGFENINVELLRRIRTLLESSAEIQEKQEELIEIYAGEPSTIWDWFHNPPGGASIPHETLRGSEPFTLRELNQSFFRKTQKNQNTLLEWLPYDTIQDLFKLQKSFK